MADLSVYITSELTSSERRVSPQWSVEHFKKKMELITGIPPESQRIWVYKRRETNERFELKIPEKPDEYTFLSEFTIVPFTRIDIEDVRPDSELKELSENSSETQYKMEDEDYDKRSNTVRRWKQEKGLGRFDPEYESRRQAVIESNKHAASAIKVGLRCRILNSDIERRGTVRYTGIVPEIDNEISWVGVELDEPYGKNNGSIKGKRYFTCKDGYGSFVKAINVEVGDFEPEDPFDLDDDEL
ncbi:unnamed protein product [Kuraishia capsulata CBS 1993]|uniref:CAP-Gly domain-containing protein n=1 Tax=Kuraishia capsulata CBS 1993 TaxID=1382522 RepID=W6MHR4_9ASCO|nr:uncharacterized protein KUCA_T00001292001 [Kuraishia capsulata CBS 1993]CDK25323.1 unnamed protein product [Kuraishia capsulata CBS 1993]